MKVSIFTPTNNPRWLKEAYESLKEQTYSDWEWVLIANGGITIPDFGDDRVKVYPFEYSHGKIGALKRYACEHCIGDIYLEFDHDDKLTPDCVEKVVKAFEEHPEAAMVFSNFAQVDINTGETANVWSAYYGWKYRDFNYKGKIVKEVLSPTVEPQNLSRIWFAPNHVRAWRATDYWKIGGHNADMNISDDHDMCARTYLYKKDSIYLIDECLYIYRIHEKQYTWLRNAEIQETMWDNYNRYIERMVVKWADDMGLRKIDLCGGINPEPGYESYDLQNGDIIGDLNETWKLEDNSVGVLRANDAIEHLKDPIHVMNEAHRVLAHGGFFMINVPSTDGRGAFQDPTHVSFWNANSFWYYTQAKMRKFIEPQCFAKFQAMRILDYQPNEACKTNNIWYTSAHLFAVKDGRRFHGYYDWPD